MFEELFGEQIICCKILNKIVNNECFSHAYLFETNGYDKAYDMALLFAKKILCPHKKNADCANCVQCQMIDENNFPELKIIDDDNTIKKEDLIDLKNEFNKKTIVGNKKVYIINHAEKLNATAANTMLKFLEEPEEGVIAILITSNRFQLLDTIISRCQIISMNGQVDFNYTGENESLHRFGQVITNSKDSYEEFCSNSDNLDKIDAVIKFALYYEKNGINMLLYMYKYWHKYFSDKASVSMGLYMLLYCYNDAMNLKFNRDVEIYTEYKADILSIAKANSIENLINKIEIINESIQNLNYNANLSLLMDKLIIQMEEGCK